MSGDTLVLETGSAGETERIGGLLAALMPGGGVIALRGDLASGKTCLVRGLAAQLTGGKPIHSPTFTLINEYGDAMVHMDLYRLGSLDEIADLGCVELFESGRIVAVEWAERAEGLLPPRRVDIGLEHAGQDRRRIVIENQGILADGWREALAEP
ncbi:MAG: tRNA threonylcarbamoyladenosine biosynthesis protein TsaE [Candidatus Hydrogenedentota bacterium]